jgi:hypothetical protein
VNAKEAILFTHLITFLDRLESELLNGPSVIESLVALDTQTQCNHKLISNTFENG